MNSMFYIFAKGRMSAWLRLITIRKYGVCVCVCVCVCERERERERGRDAPSFGFICTVSRFDAVFVAFVEDNATMSSILYFENHVLYFVQNRRK